MEIGQSLRGARAAVFAAACVGLSAAGHVWMSAGPIPMWALCAAVLATGCGGYALAGRQRGFAPIAALMLLGELGLHLLFSAAQHTVATATTIPVSGTPTMAATPGIVMPHRVAASAWLCGGTTMSAHGAMAMPWMTAHGSAGMIAAHVLAGLLCAGWLHRGEVAAFRLLRALVRLALPLLVVFWPSALTAADRTTAQPGDNGRHVATGRGLFAHVLVRRGPPTPVFCM
jgi:hypothetical protein